MNTNKTRFIAALMKKGTIEGALREAGLSHSTGVRYMHDPEVLEEIKKRKAEMLNEVSLAMTTGFCDAVNELKKIISKPTTAPQVKVNAVDVLFRNARPIIEDVDILQRLNALEDSMKEDGGNE